MVEKLANYLKSNGHQSYKLKNTALNQLDATEMFKKYDTWGCANRFDLDESLSVLFPKVYLNAGKYQSQSYSGHQILFWKKISEGSGHYYLREKSWTEKMADRIRNDDPLPVEGFEVFEFKPANNKIALIQWLQRFESEKEIEIEICNDNLFFKTLNKPSLTDLLRLKQRFENT